MYIILVEGKNQSMNNKIFSKKETETYCLSIDLFRYRGCINGRFLNDILSKINEIFVSSGIANNLCDIARLVLKHQYS